MPSLESLARMYVSGEGLTHFCASFSLPIISYRCQGSRLTQRANVRRPIRPQRPMSSIAEFWAASVFPIRTKASFFDGDLAEYI